MRLLTFLFAVTLLNYINAEDTHNQSSRGILRVYDECTKSEFGVVLCLKKKAINFIDRVSRMNLVALNDEIKIVKNDDAPVQNTINESDLENSLPRGLEARDEKLTNMLVERVSSFLSSRTIQISLPSVKSEELSRSLEEGRGKMKKMMSMMMMGFMMKMAAMVPVAIAGLYILAGKALIVSKIALLLAGIIGLKKLVAGKQGGGVQTAGWSSGGSAGWDRRSVENAQNLAYRGYPEQ